MKIICSPDSFKENFSANQIIEMLTETAREVFPNCEIIGIPMADGGEGTKDTLVESRSGSYETLVAKDALGRDIEVNYGVLDEDTVVIETAVVLGLPLLSLEERNPEKTSSYGAGQLLRHAVNKGFRNIYITVGGSATNDGGIGAMSALGLKFLDDAGMPIEPIGKNLHLIADIDIAEMMPLDKINITVMCDVENPLLGAKGATMVYGTQKGATKHQLDKLERGMANYASVIKRKMGVDISNVCGMGAAGGLSAALAVFTNAKLQSGVNVVLDILDFDRLSEGADLVISGEGRLDQQTAFGKVLFGLGQRCQQRRIPLIAIVGEIDGDSNDMFHYGIHSIMSTINKPMTSTEALANSKVLFKDASLRMFRMIEAGMMMSQQKK